MFVLGRAADQEECCDKVGHQLFVVVAGSCVGVFLNVSSCGRSCSEFKRSAWLCSAFDLIVCLHVSVASVA